MKKLLFLLLLPVFSLAQTGEKEFKLKGDLKLNKPVDWVYLRYSTGDQMMVDSQQTKTGEFKFEGKIPEPTIAVLSIKFVQQPSEDKPKRDVVQLFLEPTKMEFFAKDSLKTNSFTGSAGHLDFTALLKQQENYNSKLTPLYNEYTTFKKAKDEAGMKKIEDAINDVEKERDENVFGAFVRNHPNSPVAVYALRQYAGYQIDADKVEPLYNKLPAATRQWPSALALKNLVDISKKTGIGKMAMDFTQNDTAGKALSLSSFRGKYVLVDFWASWCGPCRAENPNVVKAFNKYKGKNFTILGVSLDRPTGKEKWLAAIHDDGLAWNQVSDLKYWDNEVAKQYGIRSIPANFLLDPNGKIIAKNLSGEELDQKLAEVLK